MLTEIKHKHSKKSLPIESGLVRREPLPGPGTVNTDVGGAYYMTYSEQLKSPKWQKRRLEILERDKFTCRICGSTDTQLHVHHKFYRPNYKAWEYPDGIYITLCQECHEKVHEEIEMALFGIYGLIEYYGFDTYDDLVNLLFGINAKNHENNAVSNYQRIKNNFIGDDIDIPFLL